MAGKSPRHRDGRLQAQELQAKSAGPSLQAQVWHPAPDRLSKTASRDTIAAVIGCQASKRHAA